MTCCRTHLFVAVLCAAKFLVTLPEIKMWGIYDVHLFPFCFEVFQEAPRVLHLLGLLVLEETPSAVPQKHSPFQQVTISRCISRTYFLIAVDVGFPESDVQLHKALWLPAASLGILNW